MEHRHLDCRLIATFCRKLGIAALVILTLNACSSREERKVEYLNRAKSLFEQQNFEKARIDVRNALQIDESFAEARYLYALILEQEQNWRQMAGNLQLAIESDENHLPARVKYGTLMLAGRVFDKASEQADAVIERDPSFAEAHALRAAIKFRQGDNTGAIASAQQALTHEPANISAVAVLTEVHKTENPKLALELIEQGIGQQSDSTALQLMRISVFEANRDLESAVAAYEQLISEQPNNLYFHYRFVSLLEANQRHDEAAELIRTLANAQPDEVQLKLWLVQYLVNHKDLPTAESTLRAYIDAQPDQFDLQIGLGAVLLAQQKETEARAHYLALTANEEQSELAQRARLALAQLELRDGNAGASNRWIDEVLELEPENPDALTLQASKALQAKNYADAVATARSVLRNRPESIAALGVLAQAHLRSNSVDLARDTFQQILAVEPQNLLALTSLASLSLTADNAQAAQEYAATALRTHPENTQAARILVAAYTQQGNTEDALAKAQEMADAESSELLGTYLLAAVHYSSQNHAELFAATLEQEPRVREAQTGLVNALLANNDKAGAIAFLQSFNESNPNLHHSRVILGNLYAQDGDTDRASQLYEEAISVAPTDPAAYERLGTLKALNGDHSAARDFFSRGLSEAPDNLSLLVRKAQSTEALGNLTEAKALYEQALASNDELVVARNNLAVLLTNDGSPEALDRAVELMRGYATSTAPALLDTLGWAYFRLNDNEQAVRYLQAAIDNGGSDPTMHFHLGMAQAETGNSAAARSAIEQALSIDANFAQADEARAKLGML